MKCFGSDGSRPQIQNYRPKAGVTDQNSEHQPGRPPESGPNLPRNHTWMGFGASTNLETLISLNRRLAHLFVYFACDSWTQEQIHLTNLQNTMIAERNTIKKGPTSFLISREQTTLKVFWNPPREVKHIQKEHVNNIFTGLSRDFSGIFFMCFSPP